MLKKIKYVFIAGLFLILLLQLLEISNLDIKNDIILHQIQLVLNLNYAAIFFLALFLLFTIRDITSFGMRNKSDKSINEEIKSDSNDSFSVNSVSEYEIRLKNLENTLMLILARCNSTEEVCAKFLSAVCMEFKLAQGILFVRKKDSDEFYIKGTYAYYNENTGYSFRIGEGVCGQVAKNQKAIILTNIPDNYVNIVSGLGLGSPKYLQEIPIVSAGEVIGVLELASFTSELLPTNDLETGVLKQLSNSLKGFL